MVCRSGPRHPGSRIPAYLCLITFARDGPRPGSRARIKRPFDGRNDLALDGKGFARYAGTRRCLVTAAAELGGDFVDVHPLVFGAQTDARKGGFQFFKYASHHHGLDSADVIDEAFRIAAVGARAREIGFLQPIISDLVSVRESEMTVEMTQQPGA